MEYRPGVYRDIPHDEYLKIPLPSASAVKIGANVTMSHMKAMIDRRLPDIDSTARRFGRAFHCWLLEPEVFKKAYRIQKHCTSVISSGKRKGETCTSWGTRVDADGRWLCGTHGKGLDEVENMVTGHELRDIQGVGKSLSEKPIFQRLQDVGIAEMTLIAEVEGVLVKTRYDYYSWGGGRAKTIVDVKKIGSMKGSEKDLQDAIRNYGYDVQAAIYKAAHLSHFGAPCEFLWLFVEDSYPYEVIPKIVSPATELVGQMKAFPVLHRWAQCVEWNHWPGYNEEPEPIDPAQWEMKRYKVDGFLS